jgi:predicted nucleic acid binding AN1-type Zn finger protein
VKIKEIMTKNPTIVPPSTTISTIQSIFNKNKFWSVYVGDSDRFLGIITRKDLHIRGKGFGPSSKAETIMSKNVLTIDENLDVNEAIRIIKQQKINGLGVTKNGKPCGIVTKADIKKRYHQKAFDNYDNSDIKRNKMTICYFCGEKIKEILPWECSYCHRKFCSDHRLPEYHNCPCLTGHAATRSFKAKASGAEDRNRPNLRGFTSYSDEKSIKFLLPSLKSDSADERKKVAILLEGRGWIPHTDAEKISFNFARQDWDTLISLGTPAFELLISGLQDKDIKIRIACARSLGILGNSAAITPLLQIVYQHGTPHLLRNEITIALRNLGWYPITDDEKISFLIAQQQWDDLIQFGEKIIGPLSALFDDNDEEIRIKATDRKSVV